MAELSDTELSQLSTDSVENVEWLDKEKFLNFQAKLHSTQDAPKTAVPLWKKGKVNTSWKKRFFLFDPTTCELSYFGSADECETAKTGLQRNKFPPSITGDEALKSMAVDTLARWSAPDAPSTRKGVIKLSKVVAIPDREGKKPSRFDLHSTSEVVLEVYADAPKGKAAWLQILHRFNERVLLPRKIHAHGSRHFDMLVRVSCLVQTASYSQREEQTDVYNTAPLRLQAEKEYLNEPPGRSFAQGLAAFQRKEKLAQEAAQLECLLSACQEQFETYLSEHEKDGKLLVYSLSEAEDQQSRPRVFHAGWLDHSSVAIASSKSSDSKSSASATSDQSGSRQKQKKEQMQREFVVFGEVRGCGFLLFSSAPPEIPSPELASSSSSLAAPRGWSSMPAGGGAAMRKAHLSQQAPAQSLLYASQSSSSSPSRTASCVGSSSALVIMKQWSGIMHTRKPFERSALVPYDFLCCL